MKRWSTWLIILLIVAIGIVLFLLQATASVESYVPPAVDRLYAGMDADGQTVLATFRTDGTLSVEKAFEHLDETVGVAYTYALSGTYGRKLIGDYYLMAGGESWFDLQRGVDGAPPMEALLTYNTIRFYGMHPENIIGRTVRDTLWIADGFAVVSGARLRRTQNVPEIIEAMRVNLEKSGEAF